jgi:hypothetical protein
MPRIDLDIDRSRYVRSMTEIGLITARPRYYNLPGIDLNDTDRFRYCSIPGIGLAGIGLDTDGSKCCSMLERLFLQGPLCSLASV